MTYDPLGRERQAYITTNNGKRMFYELGRLPYEGPCAQHWSLYVGRKYVYDTSNSQDLPWMEELVEAWNFVQDFRTEGAT